MLDVNFSNALSWWVTMVDLPALGGMFWLVWRGRKESDEALQHLRDIIDARNAQLREALAAFKLEVAKTYASITDMRDLETRLVGHLLRIESKLDATALKAEKLDGRVS